MCSKWCDMYRGAHTHGDREKTRTHTRQIVCCVCLCILSESTSNSFSIWKFHHLYRLYVHFIHSYLEWIARCCSRNHLSPIAHFSLAHCCCCCCWIFDGFVVIIIDININVIMHDHHHLLCRHQLCVVGFRAHFRVFYVFILCVSVNRVYRAELSFLNTKFVEH